jgi:hypothetical protein
LATCWSDAQSATHIHVAPFLTAGCHTPVLLQARAALPQSSCSLSATCLPPHVTASTPCSPGALAGRPRPWTPSWRGSRRLARQQGRCCCSMLESASPHQSRRCVTRAGTSQSGPGRKLVAIN